jgi:tRNA U34 5-carboxymethylaminomethyl modifying GTPase MnmE/TrmE
MFSKTEATYRSLDDVILATDRKSRNLKEKAIILFGNSRVGKSTFFNFLLKLSLIGVK